MDLSKMTEYDLICELEALALSHRHLPYAVTSPREKLSFDDQTSRVNLLFFSDSHLDYRNPEASLDNVRRTVELANRYPVPFDAVVHAGDIITPFGIRPKSEALALAEPFFELARQSRAPFVFAKGNHDLNDWGNLPENVLTDANWGRLFYDFAEEQYGIVREKKKNGEKSTWHYLDLEERRIRIVSLDVQDTDKTSLNDQGTVRFYGGGSIYFSNEQINWVVSEALCFDGKENPDWGVIFVFHNTSCGKPIVHDDAVEKLIGICAAFNAAGKYENEYRHPEYPFFDWSVSADFTRYAVLERRPHIICFLLGHLHVDQHLVREGIHLIWTLNGSATTASSDARVARILDTATQNAFDIVNIDTLHRRIRLFRYGAGQNCYGEGGDRFLPEGIAY